MEILTSHLFLWPDPTTGPLKVCVTVGLIDGRPQPVGIEMWGTNPEELPSHVTGMTGKAAGKKWGLLRADSPPVGIQTRDLRIPLGQITERSARSAVEAAKFLTSGRVTHSKLTRSAVQQEAKRVMKAASDDASAKRTGRPPLPRRHYERVAEIYTAALARGDDPTKAVSAEMFVSPGQAAKYIYRCRRPPLNLLPPTTRGRPAAGVPFSSRTRKDSGK